MSNYGIKIGDNVVTDTNQLLKFTSKYPSLKLYQWGDAQFTTNGSSEGSVSIPHDLSYAPMVVVWRKLTAQYTFLSATTYPNAYIYDGAYNSYAPTDFNLCSRVKADTTQITISNHPAIGSPLSGGNQPNTTYNFRYMIFVDKSQAFNTASNIDLTGDYGFKVSKDGKNVFTNEEYDMAYSSKYKAVQYYDNHIVESSLTLPAMWASAYDSSVEEATYVDFNHNLGYVPYFFVYTDAGTSNWYQIPYMRLYDAGEFTLSGQEEVSAWADSSRVRVTYSRKSYWTSTLDGHQFSANTINIKCIIFTEDLTAEAS